MYAAMYDIQSGSSPASRRYELRVDSRITSLQELFQEAEKQQKQGKASGELCLLAGYKKIRDSSARNVLERLVSQFGGVYDHTLCNERYGFISFPTELSRNNARTLMEMDCFELI